jgi:hypothetical protein
MVGLGLGPIGIGPGRFTPHNREPWPSLAIVAGSQHVGRLALSTTSIDILRALAFSKSFTLQNHVVNSSKTSCYERECTSRVGTLLTLHWKLGVDLVNRSSIKRPDTRAATPMASKARGRSGSLVRFRCCFTTQQRSHMDQKTV